MFVVHRDSARTFVVVAVVVAVVVLVVSRRAGILIEKAGYTPAAAAAAADPPARANHEVDRHPYAIVETNKDRDKKRQQPFPAIHAVSKSV